MWAGHINGTCSILPYLHCTCSFHKTHRSGADTILRNNRGTEETTSLSLLYITDTQEKEQVCKRLQWFELD